MLACCTAMLVETFGPIGYDVVVRRVYCIIEYHEDEDLKTYLEMKLSTPHKKIIFP